MFITARNREPKEWKPQSTGGLHSKFKVAAFSNGPLPLRTLQIRKELSLQNIGSDFARKKKHQVVIMINLPKEYVLK